MKFILPNNIESAEPTLPVRWCLEKSEHNILKERKAKFIHILFVIVYENSSLEDRLLVQIDEMMTFLSFRKPGNHTILSKIVWFEDEEDLRKQKEKLLRKVNNKTYSHFILGYDKNEIADFNWNYHHLGKTEDFDVNIPKEHFPKDPPEWLNKIISLGYQYSPMDQCEYRRRLMVSPFMLPLKIIYSLCMILVRSVVALFYLSLGARSIDYKAIVHPWRDDLNDVYRGVSNYWFLEDSNFEKRSKLFLLIHPWLYIIPFTFITYFKYAFHLTYSELFEVIISKFFYSIYSNKYYLVSIAIGLVISKFILHLNNIFKKKENNKIEPKLWELMEMERKEETKYYDDLLNLLSCGKAKQASLTDIPKEKRTVHLRFLNLKAKVCRPFAIR